MNPLSIYQEKLDLASQAILAGEFEAYAALIDLPYLIHTETSRLLATTTEDLRPSFETMSKGLRARGVTHCERVVREADYVDRDRIEGWHHTHLIADGEPVAYPKPARHVIVRRGDAWLFSEVHYPIAASSLPIDDATLFAPFTTPAAGQE